MAGFLAGYRATPDSITSRELEKGPFALIILRPFAIV